MDLAASVQKVTEEVVLRTTRHVHKVTGQENLVLAGGVALNCVTNGRILREGPFKRISGSNRPRVTPAAPWARLCLPGINTWTNPAR